MWGFFVTSLLLLSYSVTSNRSLAFEMAQKSFLGIVKALDDEQQPPVIAVAVEFLAGAITNRPLSPAMTSKCHIC